MKLLVNDDEYGNVISLSLLEGEDEVIGLVTGPDGYVNIDIHRTDCTARTFDLNEQGYVTSIGRKHVELPAYNGFLSVDFGGPEEIENDDARRARLVEVLAEATRLARDLELSEHAEACEELYDDLNNQT
jgi:hypothetical protein